MIWITEPQAWIALATLTGLEIVLGVDNIIFISILCGKLPRHQQNKARIIGGLGLHIPKGYIYFTMAFSVFVETINLRVRGKQVPPVKLRKSFSVRQIAETSN